MNVITWQEFKLTTILQSSDFSLTPRERPMDIIDFCWINSVINLTPSPLFFYPHRPSYISQIQNLTITKKSQGHLNHFGNISKNIGNLCLILVTNLKDSDHFQAILCLNPCNSLTPLGTGVHSFHSMTPYISPRQNANITKNKQNKRQNKVKHQWKKK